MLGSPAGISKVYPTTITTHRQTHTQTDRQTHTQTDTHTQTLTQCCIILTVTISATLFTLAKQSRSVGAFKLDHYAYT